MERIGHSTTRAAMIYLHTTSEQRRKIADELSNQNGRPQSDLGGDGS